MSGFFYRYKFKMYKSMCNSYNKRKLVLIMLFGKLNIIKQPCIYSYVEFVLVKKIKIKVVFLYNHTLTEAVTAVFLLL